jgi:hypothetical protein
MQCIEVVRVADCLDHEADGLLSGALVLIGVAQVARILRPPSAHVLTTGVLQINAGSHVAVASPARPPAQEIQSAAAAKVGMSVGRLFVAEVAVAMLLGVVLAELFFAFAEAAVVLLLRIGFAELLFAFAEAAVVLLLGVVLAKTLFAFAEPAHMVAFVGAAHLDAPPAAPGEAPTIDSDNGTTIGPPIAPPKPWSPAVRRGCAAVSTCAPSAVSTRKWRSLFGTVFAEATAGTRIAHRRGDRRRRELTEAGGLASRHLQLEVLLFS